MIFFYIKYVDSSWLIAAALITVASHVVPKKCRTANLLNFHTKSPQIQSNHMN